MKTILLTIVAAFTLVLTTHAQIKKGAVLLGGSLTLESFNNETTGTVPNKNESSNFSFSPSIGKAIDDNKILGFGLSYGHGENSGNGQQLLDRNSYGAFLYYRKYITLGKSFYLFGHTGLSAIFTKDKNLVNSAYASEINSSYYSLGLTPAVSYAVNKKLHLEAGLNQLVSLSYSHREEKIPTTPSLTNKSNSFGLYSNISSSVPLTVGARFLFNK